jgi:hypothetical protein
MYKIKPPLHLVRKDWVSRMGSEPRYYYEGGPDSVFFSV